MDAQTNALRIHWVVDGVSADGAGGYRSQLASNRYRAILPAQELSELGHEVAFVNADAWCWPGDGPRPDVVVIGKLLPGNDEARFKRVSQSLLTAARAASADGVVVVADFNDDHFDRPLLGEHWRALATAASVCVTGSDTMAAAVRRHTERPVLVVGDPLGSPAGAPRVFTRAGGLSRFTRALMPGGGGGPQRLKFVWYGNPVNWAAMQRWAEALAPLAAEQPFLIWAVTAPMVPIGSFIDDYNRRHGPDAAMELVTWDEATQWAVVADADVVLIPSDPQDPKKIVKTGNRLTDALNAGRHVIASPLPAYQPYAAFVALSDDPLAAARAYLADPQPVLGAIGRGQATAAGRCGPEAIAAEWLRAFQLTPITAAGRTPVAAAAAAATAAPVHEAVRLNLGCGDKILPGYINVDVVDSRAGKSPDVKCDLHDLSVFANDYADEVMAIHVVEHFWRWEVEAILREWVRVLKPGGRMVLECPNLISACEEFLKDPERKSMPSQEGQRTMWVFYGDPAWKDPYMIHRWGYTPASLAQLMQSVGLTSVRQEAAQFKLREPRDMRIVGEKA